MSDWVCMDCIADPCTTQGHAWVEATRITREDGSDAWLVGPENEDPNADDAFDGWMDSVSESLAQYCNQPHDFEES